MPVDPNVDPSVPEEPQITDPLDTPASPELPEPDIAPEIPQIDSFDDGRLPV
jgi:hypothetical protein